MKPTTISNTRRMQQINNILNIRWCREKQHSTVLEYVVDNTTAGGTYVHYLVSSSFFQQWY